MLPPHPAYEALRDGLRELGYVEGQNLAIEYRHPDGDPERLPEQAADLVRVGVDVIVAFNTPCARAARDVTETTPIVFGLSGDPVGAGLVESLQRPGGNVTGLTNITAELTQKRLELLQHLVPSLARVAVLSDPANPVTARALREAHAAAEILGITIIQQSVGAPNDLTSFIAAFDAAAQSRAEAVILVAYSPIPADLAAHLGELGIDRRLPTMYEGKLPVDHGGLMSYGTDPNDHLRRAAVYVDKILRGAKPAELPVEQPTTYEMVINVKTARSLGLTVPQAILAQATELVE